MKTRFVLLGENCRRVESPRGPILGERTLGEAKGMRESFLNMVGNSNQKRSYIFDGKNGCEYGPESRGGQDSRQRE